MLKKINRKFILLGLFYFGLILFTAMGSMRLINPYSYSLENKKFISPNHSNSQNFCKYKENIESFKVCKFGNDVSNKKILMLGDSHAESFVNGLHKFFNSNNIKGFFYKSNKCLPVPGFNTENNFHLNDICLSEYKKILLKAKKEKFDKIILIVRWPLLTFSTGYDNGEGGIEYINTEKTFVYNNLTKKKSYAVKDKIMKISEYIKEISTITNEVIVFESIPEVGWNIPRINAAHYLINGGFEKFITTSYRNYHERNKLFNDLFLFLSNQKNNIKIINTSDFFCNKDNSPNRCITQDLDGSYYHDDDHLSDYGVSKLINENYSKFIPL